MKGRPLILLLALASLAAAPAGLAAAPAGSPVAVEPPPGWAVVPSSGRSKAVVATLKGPQSSSFALARATGVATDNPASLRGYLMRVLDGVRAATKRDYRASGRVETRAFRNGVTGHLVAADLGGKPSLIVAVLETGAGPLVATLNSAAPDAMIASLVEGIATGKAAVAIQSAGTARSLDGQLEIALGGGLRARTLGAQERKLGFVLAVQGAGSEVLFMKLADDGTKPGDQPSVVRATVSGIAGMDKATVAEPQLAATAAGPRAVYSWGRLSTPPDLRFAAAYLPWGYWGYSVLARGPLADELLVGTLAALKQGPSAVAGILAAGPKIPLRQEPERRYGVWLAAAAAALLGAAAWAYARKKE